MTSPNPKVPLWKEEKIATECQFVLQIQPLQDLVVGLTEEEESEDLD